MSMNEIRAMREKRVKLWEAAKAFVESRKDVSGTLSAEDSATYDQMEADVIRMGKEIERLERQEALDLEFDRPTARTLTDKPIAPEGKAEKTGRASDSYKAAFWRTMRDKSVPHEVLNALQVGTDSEGGYLVPDEYERTLIESLEEENIFRRFAHIIRTSSGDRKIPIVVSKGTASWIDEEAAYPERDDAFGQTSISAYKLATMIKVSDELLHDSVFDVASYTTPRRWSTAMAARHPPLRILLSVLPMTPARMKPMRSSETGCGTQSTNSKGGSYTWQRLPLPRRFPRRSA